jgi:hypothetical protein
LLRVKANSWAEEYRRSQTLRSMSNFLPLKDFPRFRDAPIGALTNVRLLSANHIHWPDLDVDLTVESIHKPQRHSLLSRRRNWFRIKGK